MAATPNAVEERDVPSSRYRSLYHKLVAIEFILIGAALVALPQLWHGADRESIGLALIMIIITAHAFAASHTLRHPQSRFARALRESLEWAYAFFG